MIRLRALLLKEFIQMRRDRLTFGMMIGIPLAGERMLLVDIIRTLASLCASMESGT